MWLYFKLKMWSEYIIPIALIVFVIVANVVCYVAGKIGEWIRRRK